MRKFVKFFEYAYLLIALFFIVETFRNWADEESRSILYIILAVLALFMFFFKRWYRKKLKRENPE